MHKQGHLAIIIFDPHKYLYCKYKHLKNYFPPGLMQRFKDGEHVICAEGYLFEFERRGYLKAGAFVPEVVLEHPELVGQLYEEFVHAGSDVVEAFTVMYHLRSP